MAGLVWARDSRLARRKSARPTRSAQERDRDTRRVSMESAVIARANSGQNQRGRGRSGRAVRDRGRMRKRPSGGGTLRRKSPQQGHRPSMPSGVVASARSQWPRASQNGLMHCTVRPGRYCIMSPSMAALLAFPAMQFSAAAHSRIGRVPWRPICSPRSPRISFQSSVWRARNGDAREQTFDGAHSARKSPVVSRENLQDIVVRLPSGCGPWLSPAAAHRVS